MNRHLNRYLIALGVVATTLLCGSPAEAQFPTLKRIVATDSLKVRQIADFDSTVYVDQTIDFGTGTVTDGVFAGTDWDFSAYEVRALTFESDVTTGTAPFTIASTTLVTNLNVGLLEGLQSIYYTDANNILISTLGAATDSTVQARISGQESNGLIAGGIITDSGAGQIDVAAGRGYIRATDNHTAELLAFDFSAEVNLGTTADSPNYVLIEYNGGSPQVRIDTTIPPLAEDEFLLGRLYNEGGTLHIANAPERIDGFAQHVHHRFEDVDGLIRAHAIGGLILGEGGTRNVTVTAGEMYEGINEFDISAINTGAADRFDAYYDRGTWTKVATQSQYDNLQYDLAGVLTAIPNNKWVSHWFYVESDGELVMIYGNAIYNNLASAQLAPVPSQAPGRVELHGIIVGRILIQQAAGSGTVESAFTSIFTSAGVTDHGDLGGLADDDHTQYHTDGRALTWLGTRSTTDLSEGSNLYFTNERVDDRVDALIQDVAGKLTWTYNDGGGTLTPVITYDSQYFSGTDWTDLSDAGETALHIHDARYYTETEIDAFAWLDESESDARYLMLDTSNDPLTGNLEIEKATPILILDASSGNPSVYWLEGGDAKAKIVYNVSSNALAIVTDNAAGSDLTRISIPGEADTPDLTFSNLSAILASGIDLGASGSGLATAYITTLDLGTNTISDGNLTGSWNVTGGLTVGDQSGSEFVNLDPGAASFGDFQWLRSGVGRWTFRMDNATESGSNVGSDLNLLYRTDAGAVNGTAIKITRSSGATQFRTISPFSDNTFNSGGASARWATMYAYAGNFSGTVTGVTNLSMSGNIGIGQAAGSDRFEVTREGTQNANYITTYTSSQSFHRSDLELRRARNTAASPQAVLSGDILGILRFGGHDGSIFYPGVDLQVEATENWSGTNRGTKLEILTIAAGSSTAAVRATFTESSTTLTGALLMPGLNIGSTSSEIGHVYLGDAKYLYLGADQDAKFGASDASTILLEAVAHTIRIRPKTGEEGIVIVPDGLVNLYYNSAVRFATSAAGGTLTGDLTVTGDLSGVIDLTMSGTLDLGNSTLTTNSWTLEHVSNQANGLVLQQTAAGMGSPRLFFYNTDDGAGTSVAIYGRANTLWFTTGGTPGASTGTARLVLDVSQFYTPSATAINLGHSGNPWPNAYITTAYLTTLDLGANTIVDADVGNWNTAYGWGDHAGLYGTAAAVALNTTHRSSDGSDHTFIDQSVISGASPTFGTVFATTIDLGANPFTNATVVQWNTAYGWGDHGSGGYAADSAVLKKDGSVALTANWDAGGYEIRAKILHADTGPNVLTGALTGVTSLTMSGSLEWGGGGAIASSDDVVDNPYTGDLVINGQFEVTSTSIPTLNFEYQDSIGGLEEVTLATFFANAVGAGQADLDAVVLNFNLETDSPTEASFGQLKVVATDVSNASKDTRWEFVGYTANAVEDLMTITGSAVTWADGGIVLDLSDGDANDFLTTSGDGDWSMQPAAELRWVQDLYQRIEQLEAELLLLRSTITP